MQAIPSNSKPALKPVVCKFHAPEKVQRIDSDSLEKNPLKCVECLLSRDSQNKIPKENLSSFHSFIDQIAKLYDFVKNFSTLDEDLPTEFTECLKDEDSSLTALQKHVETEKEKVEVAFSMITEEFTTICKKKKQELLDKLDEQFENLRANFKYYQDKLDKYFGKSEDTSYPTKETIYQRLNACKSYDDVDSYVKTLKDDMLEISMYGKDPETRSKELRIALKEFSSAVLKNCKEFPQTCFSTNEKANEIKEKLQTTIKPLFDNILEVSNPIDLLSLSETGRIGSTIVTKIEDVKLLRSWIGTGIVKFKLLYRGSKDGFTGEIFHKKCDDYQPTITIIKSDKNKVFGGYSDMTWNSTNNYKTTSNSWIYSLDAKEKYKQKPNQAHYGVYCYSSYGPTFGGGHDIYIANNCNTGNPCYSNYGYSFETKNVTYSTTQAQSHLAGSYNFRVEEIEVFHIVTSL